MRERERSSAYVKPESKVEREKKRREASQARNLSIPRLRMRERKKVTLA